MNRSLRTAFRTTTPSQMHAKDARPVRSSQSSSGTPAYLSDTKRLPGFTKRTSMQSTTTDCHYTVIPACNVASPSELRLPDFVQHVDSERGRVNSQSLCAGAKRADQTNSGSSKRPKSRAPDVRGTLIGVRVLTLLILRNPSVVRQASSCNRPETQARCKSQVREQRPSIAPDHQGAGENSRAVREAHNNCWTALTIQSSFAPGGGGTCNILWILMKLVGLAR